MLLPGHTFKDATRCCIEGQRQNNRVFVVVLRGEHD